MESFKGDIPSKRNFWNCKNQTFLLGKLLDDAMHKRNYAGVHYRLIIINQQTYQMSSKSKKVM